MWFDTHCHLYDFKDDAAKIAASAREQGVEGICVVGVDVVTSRIALGLTELDGVVSGAAVHPTEAKGWDDSWADEIDELLAEPKVVAVGETGIDLHWDKTFLDDQKRALAKHVELSKKHGKALIMHTRDSIDETLDLLEEVGPPERMIFHCWSGDRASLERAVGLGAYISFAGNVTYKSAENIRDVVPGVPDDLLLVETDAPYLAPVPMRRQHNEPAFVAYTGALVAELRGTDTDELAALTTLNARTVFGLR